MSRCYRIQLTVNRFKPARKTAIQRACSGTWDFTPDCFEWNETELTAESEGYLTGGMLENEFAGILAQAIWKANRGFCDVTVGTTYLDAPPAETFHLGQSQYRAWAKEGRASLRAGLSG